MLHFPFRDLHSLSSWDSRSTIAGGLPNPGSAMHPLTLWEEVAHCWRIKLDSLMSSELPVRSSSPNKLHFLGPHWNSLQWDEHGWFGFLIFMHRGKSRPIMPRRNKYGSTHAELNRMDLFMEDIAEPSMQLGCRTTSASWGPWGGAVDSLKPSQRAFVTMHSWLCLGEGYDTENLLVSTGLSTAFSREIPPGDSPWWKSLAGFFVVLLNWTHYEFQGICSSCDAILVSKLLYQQPIQNGVMMKHQSY